MKGKWGKSDKTEHGQVVLEVTYNNISKLSVEIIGR